MPRTYRILDFLGSRMEKWGIPLTRMDAETLHQLAERETGLSDFGDPYYREGLEVLLHSIEKDANLHFFGRFGTRMVILTYMSQRMAEINKKMYTHYLEGGQKSRSDSAVNNAVLDVQYDQLVKDPMQTVKDIYAHFGVPWSDEYEECLKSFLSQHPKDKHGAHQYTPEQFGQSADELNAHFASVSDDVSMSTEK